MSNQKQNNPNFKKSGEEIKREIFEKRNLEKEEALKRGKLIKK